MPVNTFLKEKAIGLIQRDRLEDFIRRCMESNAGCLYNALLTEWEYLYPDELPPRKITERLNRLETDDLGVVSNKMTDRIGDFSEVFDMSISEVVVSPRITNSAEEIRRIFKIAEDIPVSKLMRTEGSLYETLEPAVGSGAIILWQDLENADGGHFGAFHSTSRNLEGVSSGGQEEFDVQIERDRTPIFVVYLRKRGEEGTS